jgi:cytochrome c oxidase subunit II
MTGLLMVIVLFLAVYAAAQIMRVYELSAKVREAREYEVTDKDNNTQGRLMLLFGIALLGSFVWMVFAWDKLALPKPASLHGVEVDKLWDISMGLIVFMFFIIQPVLFYFAYRYRGNSKNKAVFYAHNSKLEFIWTVVPAVVLAVLIIYGMTTWANTMNPTNDEEPIVIELYAKQFAWTARYSGEDNALGYANVRLVKGANVLGVDTGHVNAGDDFIATEIHLPVGRPILFRFRAQDVIHSAFMPHFRAQMNCVPGMETHFQFTPTVTSTEMRQDPSVQERVKRINTLRQGKGLELYEYNYLLLCNKICGSAHYNMQMNIVVETQAEYDAWVKEQKTIAETL